MGAIVPSVMVRPLKHRQKHTNNSQHSFGSASHQTKLPRKLYGASWKMSYLYLLTPSTVALWKNAFSEYSRPTLLRRLREASASGKLLSWPEGFDTRDLKEAKALLEELVA